MTLKSLLLGSAAAFAAVGGAQAADLSVAEPVEFVRICDYFGTTYWYIPGTDTCLKIGGRVDFVVNLHDLASTYDSHSSNWDFQTHAALSVTAKSMTEFGELAGQVNLQAHYSATTGALGSAPVTLDGAWLSLGALKVGHFAGPYVTDGAFTDKSPYGWDPGTVRFYEDANKIQLSWAAAGFGLALGIEDPRQVWGTALPATWSMPAISGAITASQAAWSGKLAAGFTQLALGTAWGITGQVTFNLDTIAAGDKLRLNAAYGDDTYVGAGTATSGVVAPSNNAWSAFASFSHMWSSTLSSAFTVAYVDRDSVHGGTPTSWSASADLVWSPAAGFQAKLRGGYKSSQATSTLSSWTGQVVLTRSW